jgi:hypothetical protein
MSQYQSRDRAELDAEWQEAVRRDQQRGDRAWRAIREAEQRRTSQQTQQAAERLYKEATLYDGLGNTQKALASYEAFLELHRADDALSAFARERLAALSQQPAEELSQPTDRQP